MAGFRNVVKKIVQGGGGSTGEVDRERLQYDNRNTGKKAVNPNTAAVVVAETSRMATEAVAAAVLGQDVVANRKAVEDISNTVTATAVEVGRRQADLIETVIIPLLDVNRKAQPTTVPVTINYGQTGFAGAANATVVTTGWTNPANAVDRVGGTFASLTATSSGLAGTTSNTASGTLSISFPDTAFTDIPLGSATLQLIIGRGVVSSGVLPLGQMANMALEVSINNGTSWSNLQTFTGASPAADATYDVTALIASSYANVNGLQVRFTGSVTSGTGLNAQLQAQLYYAQLRFSVSKTY